MTRSAEGLLAQIEEGALDGATPLADTLRKCIALGGRSGSEELRDWARRELDGYGDGSAELPTYRLVPAPILIDGADVAKMVRGQQISSHELPDFARASIKPEAPLPYGVAELERLAASSDSIQLQHPGMPDLALYMTNQAGYGTTIQRMYWAVSPTSLHGIVDTIRTTLVALVAEMRAAGVKDEPDAATANNAVQVVLHNAKRNKITLNTNQSSGGPDFVPQIIEASSLAEKDSRVPNWIRGPWGFVIGVATIVAGVAGVAVWVGWNPFN